jgi:cupin 2 domain-containing protein
MAQADLLQFLEKVSQLNAFVALSESRSELRQALCACDHHDQVVELARGWGFEIGRRWGEQTEAVAADDSNLLAGPCPAQGEETSTVLIRSARFRLERIHSCASTTPAGFWYDQNEHEWVMLLQGSALLQFADQPSAQLLNRGDHLLIRPHRRHRVVATDPHPGSIWLALFWLES